MDSPYGTPFALAHDGTSGGHLIQERSELEWAGTEINWVSSAVQQLLTRLERASDRSSRATFEICPFARVNGELIKESYSLNTTLGPFTDRGLASVFQPPFGAGLV